MPVDVVRTHPGLRVRREPFGALVRRPGSTEITRLSREALVLVELCRTPRPARLDGAQERVLVEQAGTPPEGWQHLLEALVRAGVLQPDPARPSRPPSRTAESPSPSPPQDGEAVFPVTAGDVVRACEVLRRGEVTGPPRPFWAHLQPFTRCNQHCVHCYCHGGPRADGWLVPVAEWMGIVDRLDAYGMFDVYVTGGESLLFEEFFTLARHILDQGLGFGVSTNATVLDERAMDRLRDLDLACVQVSLDAADAATYEFLRGVPGSFPRALDGITRIAGFTTPVINTVVNRVNLGHLERIVEVGKHLGCTSFKFFPQKPVGRSTSAITLDDVEIRTWLIPECVRLAAAHEVDIETIDPDRPCGSGSVGFAVDQHAEVYPCIFGMNDPAQRCGSLLRQSLAEIWTCSPVLERFRGDVDVPCRRCEP